MHAVGLPNILTNHDLQALQGVMQRNKAEGERKLLLLQERQAKLLKETEMKVAQISQKAAKLPEVATMLQPFI